MIGLYNSISRHISKVYYGWWILGISFFISLYVGGAITLGFTAFIEPISQEFGWSYAQISLAASLRGAEVGLLAPLTGFLMDRWGPKRLVLSGIILLGLALVLLSRTTSLGMFYGAFVLVAIGISGQSPTVLMTTLGNWFRRRLGIASGIMVSGFALGGLLVPIIVTLIDAFDWRTALFILGITTWVIGLPLSLLFKHKPEQYGLLPDGEQNNTAILNDDKRIKQSCNQGMGVKAAIKSRAFWHISLAMALVMLPVSAVIAHVMPYLSSVGIARSLSSLIAMAAPLVSIAGRLGSGWLCDRFNNRMFAPGFLAIIGLGLLLFSYVSNDRIWLVILFIILFGIGWGSNFPIRATYLREYFGRSNYGIILGFSMGMGAIGSTLGPLFAGLVFDYWGSYRIAWLSFAGLVFIASIIIATIPRLTNKERWNAE